MTQPRNTIIVEVGEKDLKVYDSSTGTSQTIARGTIPLTAQVGDTVLLQSEGENIWIPKNNPSAMAGGVNVNIMNSNNSTKSVNKLVFILLAVLLGGLGIHKFYEGKTGLGILYLLFCWTGIPTIVGLIEGLVAIPRATDANGNFLNS